MRLMWSIRWNNILGKLFGNLTVSHHEKKYYGSSGVLGGQKPDFLVELWTTKPKWYKNGATARITYPPSNICGF